jgi:hypothetical protein
MHQRKNRRKISEIDAISKEAFVNYSSRWQDRLVYHVLSLAIKDLYLPKAPHPKSKYHKTYTYREAILNRDSAIDYLMGDMILVELCGASADWIRYVLKSSGVNLSKRIMNDY